MDKACLENNYNILMKEDKAVDKCCQSIRTQEETAIRRMEKCIKSILKTQENKELPLSFKNDSCTQMFEMEVNGENITLTKVCLETNSRGETFVIVKGVNDDMGTDYEEMLNNLDFVSCNIVWIALKSVIGNMMLEGETCCKA